ncbi:hypothetical protein BT96DRAFT_1025270 [Gymnopus androsaceus JB14]|uniref:Uncharacterized protein n=1 Tax=Gymnopus androsaceus JB14 TaxID=1447944 RepID=A0A6A4GU07_9AGAR|nr:hypothetical protein BT96DRAFT_1025270 [Gymnopus androsaceus JB14]
MDIPGSPYGYDPDGQNPYHRLTRNASDAYNTPISAPLNHSSIAQQPNTTPASNFPRPQMNVPLPVHTPTHPAPLCNTITPHARVPTVTAPMNPTPRPLPYSASAPLHPPTVSERLRSQRSLALMRVSVRSPIISEPDFSSNISCSSCPMSLTSFVPSPTPYIHLPYQANTYQYLLQPPDHQEPQVPSRPPSAVVQQYNPRIQHPQPYQPYATAHLATIGEDATIAGQFDLRTHSVPPVTGNPILNALHPGVAPQPPVHLPGVAQQMPVHPGYMQYAYPIQDQSGLAPINPFSYSQPPPANAIHAGYAYPDPMASKAKVKLFSSILSAFMSTIDNDAELRNCQNWACWHDSVLQALADGGVIGHICSEPAPGIERTEYNTPVYRLLLSPIPHPTEIEARRIWDRDNAWASSVLMAHLHNDARGFLGLVIDSNGRRRTAREMYDALRLGCQAAPDYTNCLRIQDKILSTQIPTILTRFIQNFPNGNHYAIASDKCQEALDAPGSVPSREMFDAFAIKLTQAKSLSKGSFTACSNNTNNNRNQQQDQGGKLAVASAEMGVEMEGGNGGANGGANGGGKDTIANNLKQGMTTNNTNTNQCQNNPDVPLDTTSAPLGASNIITRQSYPARSFESFSALSTDLHPETLQSYRVR